MPKSPNFDCLAITLTSHIRKRTAFRLPHSKVFLQHANRQLLGDNHLPTNRSLAHGRGFGQRPRHHNQGDLLQKGREIKFRTKKLRHAGIPI
jgi:hypothetical protein